MRVVDWVARASLAAFAFGFAATPICAADETDGPKGAAVTVLKASKTCFADNVEVYGILIPKDEVAIRPDRPGAKVADVFIEPGESVTSGQTMARLLNTDGTTSNVTAPVAGIVNTSSVMMGAPASPKGEALFTIISRSEFDLIGMVPTRDLSRLAANQAVRIRVLGANEMAGKVRSIAATVEPNTQLGQVVISVNATRRLLANSSARAIIKTGESCGVSVPLTSILYGNAGTVVQVVRRQRIETRRVEVGLMSGGRVEIRDGLNEGDDVVARAGALLREGDPVRPMMADAEPKK
jgi:multidrug efflux pump subunit AcrA (membrane-fusion protein)